MNQNAKETIRQKLPIESVVGSYIKLEKAGRNFRACCPFHHEKTPSFYVTVDKGIYYCYGCHRFGDIFKFIEEIEGVSFMDALRMLADKAGVSLDDYRNEKPSRISVLREIMDVAAKFYEVGLRTHPAAVDYLVARGVEKATMVSFRIGYAPKGWSGAYDALRKRGYADEDILATGLCIRGSKGVYDRFRERVMFPISDGQGRVIAFTGRVLPGTDEASRPVGKYINSPETELYHKSSVLFGYDKAKSAIHTENFVIIVEGQMDLVMSHQAGVANVVALSGTAATDLHMEQIARFTSHVAICLDADRAGLAAAQKTAMVAYRHDMKVLVIDMPAGTDPADLIAKDSDSWKAAIAGRRDFVTFRLEKMRENGEMDEKVAIAEHELFPVLAHLSSRIALDDKLQEIAHAFGSSTVDPVRAEFEAYLRKHPPGVPGQAAGAPQHSSPSIAGRDGSARPPAAQAAGGGLEERITGILLALEEAHHGHPFSPEESAHAEALKARFESLIGSFSDHCSALPDDARASLVFRTEQLLGTLPESVPAYLRTGDDLLSRFEISAIEREKEALDREILRNPDDTELLQRAHTLLTRRDTLIRMLVNQ